MPESKKLSKRILIAEDERPLRAVLKKKVTKLGYQVITAQDGTETLEKFVVDKPDLILLDIVMPEKSGFEVLEEIRMKHKSTIPVIIISNLSEKQDVETAKRLGIQDYVLKSNISLRELMIKINAAFSAT